MSSNSEEFKAIGLSGQKTDETLKNENLTKVLSLVCGEVNKLGNCPPGCGMLLYHLASTIKAQIENHIPLLVKYIFEKKLTTVYKVDAGMKYLLSDPLGEVNIEEFEKACGIGVTITPEDVERVAEEVVLKYKSEILEKRYKFNSGPILREVREKLKWADGKDIRYEVDLQIFDLLGPKCTSDLESVRKRIKRENKSTKSEITPTVKQNSSNYQGKPVGQSLSEMFSKLNFHEPGENFKTDGYVVTPETNQLLLKHCQANGGKVRTRFPPEPNGILHIGHAKAININFGYAGVKGGECYLRYDDTNPEKEEEKFFTGIKEAVEWLGYTPDKITHSSDYFDTLYEWAKILIMKGLAYVCHQKQEEMQGFTPLPSPWRDRPIEENLLLFEAMKKGKCEEGECTLRMKLILQEGKLDPVAYRVKYLPHHRTGNKWCIYPTYDYTHCLCDSIENISHSLCTKEFQSRRSSYYWLCNAVNVYCPVQWEYGRLNMNYTVVSKRKILKLIEEGIVKDWDDPRLFTLPALRRRGFPPEAINNFCAQMGVTGAQSIVDPSMLDACVRDVLNRTAPRTMVVVEPLEVEIVEGAIPDTKVIVHDFPTESNLDNHTIKFSKTLYIEDSDFKMVHIKGYRRLTPEQPVGLKHVGLVLIFRNIVFSPDNPSVIQKIEVAVEHLTDANKPKAFIHWVSNPIKIQLRLYSNLFHNKNPEDINQVPNGFLSDVNLHSLEERDAFADAYLQEKAKHLNPFQFERWGFFSVDPDSRENHLIFNRTVALKEDSGKI